MATKYLEDSAETYDTFAFIDGDDDEFRVVCTEDRFALVQVDNEPRYGFDIYYKDIPRLIKILEMALAYDKARGEKSPWQ